MQQSGAIMPNQTTTRTELAIFRPAVMRGRLEGVPWQASGLPHPSTLMMGFEGQPPIDDVDDDLLARPDLASEEHPGELVIELSLDGPAHRPRTEFRLVAMFGQPVNRGRSEPKRHVLGVQATPGVLQQELGDLAQLTLIELTEDDDLVDPVQELRTECLAQAAHQLVSERRLLARSRAIGPAGESQRGSAPGSGRIRGCWS